MRGRGFSDFAKALGLFIGGFFLFIATLFIVVVVAPIGCKSRIEGGEEAIGAKVYLKGQFLGVMEKRQWTWNDKVFLSSQLCTGWRLGKGDLLRVVKRDYKIYEAVIDPYIDESGPPYRKVHIELVPATPREKCKGR